MRAIFVLHRENTTFYSWRRRFGAHSSIGLPEFFRRGGKGSCALGYKQDMFFKKICFALVPLALLSSGVAQADSVAVHFISAKKHVVVYASPSTKKGSFRCEVHRTTGSRGKTWAICSASDYAGTSFECKSGDSKFISLVQKLKGTKLLALYSKNKKSMWKKGQKRPLRPGSYASCSKIELNYGL